MVTPAAANWRISVQLMWVGEPRSTASVATNRVKGRPAAFSRGQASVKAERLASSMVIATVRSGSGLPLRRASRIFGSGRTW